MNAELGRLLSFRSSTVFTKCYKKMLERYGFISEVLLFNLIRNLSKYETLWKTVAIRVCSRCKQFSLHCSRKMKSCAVCSCIPKYFELNKLFGVEIRVILCQKVNSEVCYSNNLIGVYFNNARIMIFVYAVENPNKAILMLGFNSK